MLARLGEVGAVFDEDIFVSDELGKAELGFLEEKVFAFNARR